MSVAESISRIIKNHGGEVAISSNTVDLGSTKAFIQPLRYKNRMYIDGKYLAGGYSDGSHYLYIGLPDIRIDRSCEDIVLTDEEDREFFVKQAEVYSYGGEPLYIWAILTAYNRGWENE